MRREIVNNEKIMETMTFQYNPADVFMSNLVAMIRSVKNIKIINDTAADVPNAETLQAIEDVRNGKVFHAASTDDLFKQILG